MEAIKFYESKCCTPKYISAITSKRLKKHISLRPAILYHIWTGALGFLILDDMLLRGQVMVILATMWTRALGFLILWMWPECTVGN